MPNNTQVAIVFPGQGSQTVGMLHALAVDYPVVKQTFMQASEALSEDLWDLAQSGPQEVLNLTANAQPLLLTASVAVWRVINESFPIAPVAMAGHSLGEWSALVCAGALDFADAVRLVRLRGQYMQQAVPVGQGTMAAIIGLADEVIVRCCTEASEGEVVDAVNFNSPGQVVIAGHLAAVERAIKLCKQAGAKRALPLSVSAPFHTSLMRPAAERLAADIDSVNFSMPKVPIFHNVHGQQESDVAALKSVLVTQIHSPVRWVDCVQSFTKMDAVDVIECGPGKVLSGLVKRINKSLNTYVADSPEALLELRSVLR